MNWESHDRPCPVCNPPVQIVVAYCDGGCLNGVPHRSCEVRKDYVTPEELDGTLAGLLDMGWHILSVEQR